MEQRIELIGVDSHESRDGSDEKQVSGVAQLATVQRNGVGGTGRRLGVALALAALAVVLLLLPADDSPVAEPDRVAPVESSSTTAVAAPVVAPMEVAARQTQPVVAAASGITLIVGRGVEKTFIDLDTGNKMVVDVDGEPVAGISGYVALAIDHGDDGVETCWFSLADRRCGADPTRLTGGSSADAPRVHEFDPVEVRSLVATTHDERWTAGWRFGQLIVTDQSTGEVSVVPGVQRSYFDDAMALIG